METHSTLDDGDEVPHDGDIDSPGQSIDDTPDAAASAVEPPNANEAGDDLEALATRARSTRLTPAEEERATALLKEAMAAGKNGIARVVETIPSFSWLVAVRAIETVWSELKPAARTQFLKGLAEQQSEAARRIRLSLARALFKQDVPVALKIAASIAKEMVKDRGDTISTSDAQIFSNVFIGKAKPWIAQLPLADLKSSDADAIVQCAIIAAFTGPHPPPTQLGVLKWANETGRLEKLDATVKQSVVPVVSRWSAKWRGALINEIQPLPESITAAVRKEPQSAASSTREAGEPSDEHATRKTGDIGESVPDQAETPPQSRKERPVYQPRPQKTGTSAPAPRPPDGGRERPVYQPRSGAGGSRDLNVSDVLRQIEAHVAWLRGELQSAQAKLREEAKQTRGRKSSERVGDINESGATFEELARTNVQLEARITELQTRIDDLLADAEDRAASMRTEGEGGAPSQDAQLRALLALKLQESFADFSALEKESPSIVVQQHYRSLLQEVFAVLRSEGIALEAPPSTH